MNATVFRHLLFKLPGSPPPSFMLELIPPEEERAWRRRFAVAPDVKNHTGTNWTNIAAIAEIERGEAYGDPAAHHGDHGGEHGGEHGTPEEHGTENHGGAHEGGH